jgi:hypothetical protein
MKNGFSILLTLVAILGMSVCAFAQDANNDKAKTVEIAIARPANKALPVTAKKLPQYLDEDLVKQHKAFRSFARVKISALNRNHRFSRSRMVVTKMADGTYKARYHVIAPESMVCQVRRSKSKTVPYVGVLSYKEKIFEASGTTAKEARKAQFHTVKVIPNRHIFCYKNGWK